MKVSESFNGQTHIVSYSLETHDVEFLRALHIEGSTEFNMQNKPTDEQNKAVSELSEHEYIYDDKRYDDSWFGGSDWRLTSKGKSFANHLFGEETSFDYKLFGNRFP